MEARNVGCTLHAADAGCGRTVTMLLWRGNRHRPHASEIEMKSAETTAHTLKIGLGPVAEIQRPEEIAGAFSMLAKEAAVDGVLVVGGTMVFANRAELEG